MFVSSYTIEYYYPESSEDIIGQSTKSNPALIEIELHNLNSDENMLSSACKQTSGEL